MAKWLEINSTNLIHFCGEDVGHTLANALNGIAAWWHTEDAPHEFELDLGSNFIITKVRGRSDAGEYDPRDISIYVSQDRSDYGAAVANVTTWYDTIVWVEISTTTKIGRYVKIVIETTENRSRYLRFGAYELEPAFAIFDVYADPGPGTPHEAGDAGWYLVSLPKNQIVPLADTFYLYNGTYYTFAQASTNDNETGSPIILPWFFGWDRSMQNYSLETSFVPYYGYWQYYYKPCSLWIAAALADIGADIEVIPGRMISLK